MYYALRERQLQYQYRHVAVNDPAIWRPADCSAAASRPNLLLAARNRPQMRLQLPQSRCGVEANDSAVFIRTVDPPPAAASKPLAVPAPRGLAHTNSRGSLSSASSSSLGRPELTTCTPPRLLEQPAKRSRLDGSGSGSGAPPPRPAAQRSAGAGLAGRAVLVSPTQHGHLIAYSLRGAFGAASGPVIIPMPASAASYGCHSMASSPRSGYLSRAAAPASSPLVGWLSRLRGMLTPGAEAVTAC